MGGGEQKVAVAKQKEEGEGPPPPYLQAAGKWSAGDSKVPSSLTTRENPSHGFQLSSTSRFDSPPLFFTSEEDSDTLPVFQPISMM